MKHRMFPAVLAALLLAGLSHAAPPLINYQGRIVVGTTNFHSPPDGQFKFALVDGGVNQNVTATAHVLVGGQVFNILVMTGGSGYVTAPAVTITDSTGTGATAVATVTDGAVSSIQVTSGGSGYSPQTTATIAPPLPNILTTTFWSNDQTSVDGSEPSNSVSLPVVKGLYSVLLGDNSMGEAMRTIGAADLAHPDVRLRVWFSDGVNGFQLLSPDQRLAPASYLADGAVQTENIADGSIQSAHIADDAVEASKIAFGAVTAEKIAGATINISHLIAQGPGLGNVLTYDGIDIAWAAPSDGIWALNASNDAYFNGGRVGIGTANPLYNLDVHGPSSFQSSTEVALNVAAQWGQSGTANIKLTGSKPTLQWDAIVSFPLGTRSWIAHVGETRGLEFWTRSQTIGIPPGDTGWRSRATLQTDGSLDLVGNLSCKALTIRGADVAEPFDIAEEDLPKGTVVVIDETQHGRLKRSTVRYDTCVAGIVSGANGIDSGIILSQPGVNEGGQNVAISGRVYVQADATRAPIKAGDLLTTSDIPGHAMKVMEPTRAQGAVIGKAMSSLNEGTGMVLVLVTLQ